MKAIHIFRPLFSLAVLLSLATPPGWAAAPEPTPEKRDELYREIDLLGETLHLILRNYVDEVDSEELVHGAIEGILTRLDPHSSFLPPHVFGEEQEEMRGAFEGVGIELTSRDGRLTVIAPIEDGPADKAGVLAGDVILEINGESALDLPFAEAVKHLRGPKGTKVTLALGRKGVADPVVVTVERDTIKVKSVKSRRIDDMGYLRITKFQKGTDIEAREALGKITSEGAIKGLVLDLRNNPGGLLDQAVKVSDIFLTEGVVVTTRSRDPDQQVAYRARKDGDEPTYPIIVLVNVGTASASEIVAGALKDHKRALILGERTFGKGSVQTLFPLRDGSAVRLTSALYYTPADRSIQAKGIEPDIMVSSVMPPGMAGGSGNRPADAMHRQLREEDLGRHFDTPDGVHVPDRVSPMDPDAPEEMDDGGDEEELPGKTEEANAKRPDVQLDRALELLKSWETIRAIDQAIVAPAPAAKEPAPE